MRIVYLGAGWFLVLIVTPAVGVLPGPGGVFIFAGGLALLLKNSNWVKRGYVRVARKYPKIARLADKGLRRPLAPRGRAKKQSRVDISKKRR